MADNKKQTVLVTGGAGYIGTAITQLLIEAGHAVVVFDDLSTGQRDKVPTGATFVVGDTLDVVALENVFSQHHFDAVIHCAAKKVMSESESQPGLYYRNNVLGTLNVLDAMAQHGVPKIIFSSTAAVYAPTTDDAPVVESSPTEPVSVYGKSKLMAEMLIEDYVRLGKISSCIILRYFNVAGDIGLRYVESQAQGVFSIIGRAYAQHTTFSISGTDYPTKDGSGVRDYIHLRDLARAHVDALTYEGSGVFNLGTSNGYTVRELVDMFQRVTGSDLEVTEAPRRPGDLAVMLADPSKARRELGWEAQESLEDMVRSTVAVYNIGS